MASVKKKPATNALPRWDLTDLYPAPTSPLVRKDIQKAGKLAATFSKRYSGKMKRISAAGLAKAIREFEIIQEVLGKLASYAQLLYSDDMSNAVYTRFYQNTIEAVNQIASQLVFFTLEINHIPDKKLKRKLKERPLKAYAPWLRDVRVVKPYQLSAELEQLLLEKQVTGANAWNRLFEETIAAMEFTVGGKTVTSAEVFDFLSAPSEPVRREAAKEIARVFGKQEPLFALITNTLAKDKAVEDRWRGFKKPISSRNVSNFVEDEVVESLVKTVKSNYSKLSHRYYRWKASQFGKKNLNYWDRNAPLPGASDRSIPWSEATSLVLSSYAAFSPELAKIGKQFFDKKWIDVPVRPGKSPGAFAHPTVPSSHPYLLLNYQGKTRDVMTLAHELGHGVHQVLSAKQGPLMADTPLTLAETASVFGEMLTFQELLRREKDKKARRHLIASKVEDMLNTVVRQIAFCDFETRLHDARREGELSAEQIGALWMDSQRQSLGPAITLHPEYRVFWSYIPHFVHTPFYVYAYAFGDCLVNSLYAVYQKQSKAGKAREFEKKYLAMLSAGGTMHHKELLKPFGLDASKPDFWQQGLNMIAQMIDELED